MNLDYQMLTSIFEWRCHAYIKWMQLFDLFLIGSVTLVAFPQVDEAFD